MKYTVTFTAFAESQLATIWLRAKNQQAVADASDQMESMLRNNAEEVGQLRSDGRRAIAKPPLGFTYEVHAEDRRVTVVSIRYLPRFRKSQ